MEQRWMSISEQLPDPYRGEENIGMNNENITAERIRKRLTALQMTQRELAEATGRTEPTISRWIKGERIPSATDYPALSRALQCTCDYLLGLSSNPKKTRIENAMEQKWIPVAEQMPPVETEVLITARRRYTSGTYREIVTTAMYEDGTVLENDSCWNWIEIDGKWDEENECYIIPEGWWENRHYNPDDVYDNLVDDKVIAWMPLPEPYRESEEEQ